MASPAAVDKQIEVGTEETFHRNGASHHPRQNGVRPSAPPVIQPKVRAQQPDFDIATLSLDELSNSEAIYNRELAWLDFNWRVLHEGMDKRTPLLERLRFMAITASNLDEFFRKRVGGLKRQQSVGVANLNLRGWTPDYQLELISRAVRPMVAQQSDCLLDDILPALAEHDVCIMNYTDLNEEQKAHLKEYYLREVYPILTPLAVDPGHPFPFLSNMSLSLAVLLRDPTQDDGVHFARVKVPANRPRWVPVDGKNHFVPLEQIITHNLGELFKGLEIIAAYPFRVTRNATIERNEEEADDLLEMISEEVRERRFAAVVRLEIDESMPREMRSILQRELGSDVCFAHDGGHSRSY